MRNLLNFDEINLFAVELLQQSIIFAPIGLFLRHKLSWPLLHFQSLTKLFSPMPTWLRILFCIFFPPLAVIDKGIVAIILVLILTCLGWLPGVIGALFYANSK